MRVPNSLAGGSVTFNMTPMIDVVFLLIIFFLVSSHLAKQESQMELPLPIAESGSTPDDVENRRVTVNVQEDGQLVLAGRPIRRGQLQQRLQDAAMVAGGELEVRIRSDRHVDYGSVEPILIACARAGVWDVTFAVYRPEDVR